MGYDGALVLEFLARTHETSLLTDREKHLIGLAVTMTRGCQVMHAGPHRESTGGRHRGRCPERVD